MAKRKRIKKDLEEVTYDAGCFGDWTFDIKKGQGYIESFAFQEQLKLKNFSGVIRGYLSGRRRVNIQVFQWIYYEN